MGRVIKILLLTSSLLLAGTSDCVLAKSNLEIALNTVDKATLIGNTELEQLYIQKAILAVLLKQEACKDKQ